MGEMSTYLRVYSIRNICAIEGGQSKANTWSEVCLKAVALNALIQFDHEIAIRTKPATPVLNP